MASKVNTRFVIIVVLALGAALALLGGVYVLKLRGDATRSYRKGMEALDRGDIRAAQDQFARALNKEPGSPEYLRLVEETLLQIVPDNIIEAQELYGRYINVLGHNVLHNPKSAETHLRLLKELHSGARRVNVRRSWEMIKARAESMSQQLAEGDPDKPRARVYRALAMARLSTVESDENLMQALKDLDEAAAALNNDDLAWATEINFRMAWIDKMRVSGKSQTSIDAQREELAKKLEVVVERVPNGPESARAHFLYLLMQRFSQPPDTSITDEQLRQAAEHANSLIAPESDVGLITEVAGLLELMPNDGPLMATALLERTLQVRPTQFDFRVFVARLRYHLGELDQAEEAARLVIAGEQLPVSFLSEIQYDLRRQAASIICDVEFRRWQLASETDKPGQLEKFGAARDALAAIVPDAGSDQFVMRADGKMAYARQNYALAAQKFEQLTRETKDNDQEILSFAAASLERVGQIGLAHERLSRAVALRPGYVPWIVTKANLELRMGRTEDARRTIDAIPDTALTDPQIQAVVANVRRAAGGAAPTDDPVQAAVASANEALMKNEIDNARAALLAALADHAESLVLHQALAQVEWRADNREKAREYVASGLRIKSDDALLKQMEAGLRFDDPIQAALKYHETTISGPTQRAQTTMVAMAGFADQQRKREQELTGQNDATGAQKARDLAQRADAEAEKAANTLAASSPDDRALLDYRFSRAMQSKQWDKATELASTGRRLDADGAGGMLFQGRLELARDNYPQAISALEAATDRLSFSSSAWRLLAIAYQSDGNFAQAERAYEQAYRCNPNDIDGARAYLVLLSRRGDKTRALQILRSVHRMAPQDKGLREAWLDLEAEVDDRALALHERMELYRDNPKDYENSVSLARLLVTLEPTREVILNDQGEPTFTEARWTAMSASETEHERNRARDRWNKLSDEIVAALSKELGDDLRVAVLQATAQRERGDLLGGENILRDFIARREKSKQTEDMYVELGRYQAAINHYSDAIESMRQAVALGGPRQRDAQINLAGMLMQLRQHDEALKNLEAALAARDDQNTRLQIVECLIHLRRFDEAEARLKEATTGAGGSVTTLLAASIVEGRARAIVETDPAAADRFIAQQRDLLAKAEQQDPNNPLPRILLARSLLEEFNRSKRSATLDDALRALNHADGIRAGMQEVGAVRVAVLKAKGDVNASINELRRMLQVTPDNVSMRRDLIQLLLDGGHEREAMEALDAAIRENPTLAVWHEFRGDMMRTRRQAAQAVESYTRAYDLAPSTPMLLKLTGMMLESEPRDCRAVADRLAPLSEEMVKEPLIRETYARALGCLGQRDQAMEHMRQAYAARTDAIKQGKAEPSSLRNWLIALLDVFPVEQPAEAEQFVMDLCGGKASVYELNGLVQVWLRTGQPGLSRVLELQRQAVTLCPADDNALRVALNAELANYLVLAGNLPEAVEAYEIIIRLQPSHEDALNNLAYILAENLDRPKDALPMADRLAQLAPRKAAVLDTVGWVYFKNGDFVKAKQYLMEALAILPLADTYVHLAAVLLALGDAPGAENQLEEAEKLNPGQIAREKMKALRDDIQKKRTPGG